MIDLPAGQQRHRIYEKKYAFGRNSDNHHNWKPVAGRWQLNLTTALGRLLFIATLPAVVVACGDGTGPSDRVRSIAVMPERVLTTSVGEQTQFGATALDRDESIVGGVTITWEALDATVASVDENGLVTGLAVGVTIIRARFGTVIGDATFEVYIDPNTGPFVAGQSYLGRRDYIEYLPGNLPVIISAPHGGNLRPQEVADRESGVTGGDTNTREMALQARDSIFQRTGRYPHLIISHLHRSKLDPNREIVEAAQGDIFAEHAWSEFHSFMQTARSIVATDFQRGLYFDYHGHGHPIQRIELGYLLSAEDLAQPDAVMNGAPITDKSSIRMLASDAAATTAELIRGPQSFGTTLEGLGFPTVPSTSQPDPGTDPYFTGGFNTQQYGSRDGGSISGIQVEAYFNGVRDTEASRGLFAAAMTSTIETYLLTHFGIDWNALPIPRPLRLLMVPVP